MTKIHRLLARQLRRYVGDYDALPEEWREFVDAINESYEAGDRDGEKLKRSLEISSQELVQTNSELRAIFQALPDLYLRLKVDGTVLEGRAGKVSDFHLPAAEMCGRRIQSLLGSQIGGLFEKSLEEVIAKGSMVSLGYVVEERERRTHFEARLLPLRGDEVICIVRNVTDQWEIKETELRAIALQAENERKEQELLKARELEGAYQALEQKNRELETLDQIVQTINRELTPEDVMKVLLEQGLELLPHIHRGAFTTLDREHDRFEVVTTCGWEEGLLVGFTLTVEEAFGRYTQEAEKLAEGIFLVREPGSRPGAEKLRHIPPPFPTALLSIAVTLGEDVEGFLVFATFEAEEELQDLDLRTLKRYRQHAISALDKARAYRALQERNRLVEEKNQEILRTQSQLVEQTVYLNSLIESSPLAIVVIDAKGCVQMLNPAFENLFQYPQREADGRSLRDLIAGEEQSEEVAKVIEQVRRGHSVYQEATLRQRRDGSKVEVEVHAVPLMIEGEYAGSFGIYRDISERKQAERALFEEKERAQVTLDSIGDAVIRTDSAGSVEYMNPVAENLTGWSATEAMGGPLSTVFRSVDEKSHGLLVDPVSRCLAEARVIVASERRILVSRSGEEYPIHASAAPIRDREGAILGAVLVFKDVTAERRMAQQVIQSEKMASLGQLVAGVAHEINNPVNFISSGLPSLRRDIDQLAGLASGQGDQGLAKLRQRTGKLLAAIEDGAHRTAEIVRNLRAFSRLGEAAVRTADLHQALDATLSLLHNQTKHRIRVVRRYGDIPCVECYLSQLNQVFMNVLVNAIQAIDGEGAITLTTARGEDGSVRISIRDTGRGMSEDVRRKIFDPFFTTKSVGQGTGLGLSISHGIVEKHGGTIEVETRVGEGTEFILQVPERLPDPDSSRETGAADTE